jgi:C-terminal processing protease CtpA/Prc
VRVPNYWNLMSISAFTQGKGVTPDVEVVPTLEEFLTGKDRVLDIAKTRDHTVTSAITK